MKHSSNCLMSTSTIKQSKKNRLPSTLIVKKRKAEKQKEKRARTILKSYLHSIQSTTHLHDCQTFNRSLSKSNSRDSEMNDNEITQLHARLDKISVEHQYLRKKINAYKGHTTSANKSLADVYIPLNKTKTVWISEKAYCKLKNVNEPSKFISNLAYSTIGHDNLAKYNLKKIKGTNKYENFPEDVLNVINGMINQFLKDSGCGEKLRYVELSRINNYLLRAINYSKKKVSRNLKTI